MDYINGSSGRVLEVGVGTGLSLPLYQSELQVTGIDFSAEMLQKAHTKVRDMKLKQVKTLRQMDARSLNFPDSHFDTVAALHVLSVVPEPEKVMAEIARVCRPGGKVVIANHFVRAKGFLAVLERATAPFANLIGWHSDFKIDTVMQEKALSVEVKKQLPPLGMMTFLVLKKL